MEEPKGERMTSNYKRPEADEGEEEGGDERTISKLIVGTSGPRCGRVARLSQSSGIETLRSV